MSMGTYKFLPHTADEKFEVLAETLEDGFATSLKAFYEILLGPDVVVSATEHISFTISGKTLRSLLYDFLNELVFYFDDSDLLLQHVSQLSIIESEDGYVLEASLAGEKHYTYDLVTEIKNMTYSEMSIEQQEDTLWKLIVVVDI